MPVSFHDVSGVGLPARGSFLLCSAPFSPCQQAMEVGAAIQSLSTGHGTGDKTVLVGRTVNEMKGGRLPTGL